MPYLCLPKASAMRLVLLLFLGLFWQSCQGQSGDPSDGASAAGQDGTPDVQDSLPSGIDLDYLLGKFDPATHPDFVAIEPRYASREGMYLRKETYEAFKRMHAAALEDGIRLVIVSAARNFDHQKRIWDGKWTGKRLVTGVQDIDQEYPDPAERALKILEYSSMPGASRHHWGADVDLNNLNNSYFRSGEGKKIYDWLVANAPEYGFCQVYTPKGPDRPSGYNEERWHWSYLPIARPLTDLAERKLQNKMFTGFEGSEAAYLIDIVKNFVLGVNTDCR